MENREQYIQARKDELENWKSKVESLRVKGNLAKLELREKRDAAVRAFDRARDKFRALREEAADRWQAARKATDAAWHEFREAYDEYRSSDASK